MFGYRIESRETIPGKRPQFDTLTVHCVITDDEYQGGSEWPYDVNFSFIDMRALPEDEPAREAAIIERVEIELRAAHGDFLNPPPDEPLPPDYQTH